MIHETSQRVTPASTYRVRRGSIVPAPCAACSADSAARFPHRVTRTTATTVELTHGPCGRTEMYPATMAARLAAGE